MRLRRVVSLSLILVLWTLVLSHAWAQEPVVRFFFFYSAECDHCQWVMREVLPPLFEKYGDRLQARYFEIAVPENYLMLLDLESRFRVTWPGLPEIFIGDRVLINQEEIEQELPGIIEACFQSGGCDWPDPSLVPVPTPEGGPTPAISPSAVPTTTPQPTPTLARPTATPTVDITRLPEEGCRWCGREAGGPGPILYVAYLYDTTCRECDRVSYELDYFKEVYPNLYVRAWDVTADAEIGEALGLKYGLPQNERLVAPTIFVGDEALVGPANVTHVKLAALFERYATTGTKPPWEGLDLGQSEQSIVQRFLSFSALTVIGAGLIDGVNPCAFTTIVFFVSYLALIGRKGRDILLVGGAFTLGVFATYLLVGLGVLSFLSTLAFLKTLSRLVYLATAVLCAALAVLSLYDFIQARRGRPEEMRLRLPRRVHQQMHQTIRQHSRLRGFMWGALGTGVVVSLLELACTGQVYLPTIIFVTKVPELRAHGVFYLVLYNLMFIAPLVVVFLLAFCGTTSRQLGAFLERHVATVKLLTAALFAVLAVWLFASLLY
ncbi:MAG: hypothetical protein H5T64_10370 [Chloroflexi bacterium]|nr:hypothetical protein [Chloroflexota bacterium]